MTTITSAMVEQAIKASGETYFQIRECSLCDHPIYYTIINGVPYLSTSCDCVIYTSDLKKRSWQDLADIVNMQTDEQWHNHFMELFGLKEVT